MQPFRFHLLILFFFSLAFQRNLHATVWKIGEGKPIHQIKVGIDKACNGDTLMIFPGLYKEGNILINKSLTVIGVNRPVIDGDRRFEVITIKCNHVKIMGFKVQHSGYATLDDPGGIKIQESQFVEIVDNILFDNFFGIYVQYGSNCLLKGNLIVAKGKEEQQIGNGIHAWKSDSLLIIGNRITGHRDGIYFEFVTNSVIWRNISERNIRYGLHFMFSNNDGYFTNVFRGNGAGVAVMFSNHVCMMNNKFIENWGDAAYGILLKEISDSYITGNKFEKNTTGIFMEGTSRILAEKNSFLQNGWGMQIQASCIENRIVKNNFISNTFDVGTNGSVVLNYFDSNYWDKYEGYDINKDGVGDVVFRPLSLFSVIIERNPSSMLLFKSIIVTLLDKSEKMFPTLTPENFVDNKPKMHKYRYD